MLINLSDCSSRVWSKRMRFDLQSISGGRIRTIRFPKTLPQNLEEAYTLARKLTQSVKAGDVVLIQERKGSNIIVRHLRTLGIRVVSAFGNYQMSTSVDSNGCVKKDVSFEYAGLCNLQWFLVQRQKKRNPRAHFGNRNPEKRSPKNCLDTRRNKGKKKWRVYLMKAPAYFCRETSLCTE